MDVTKERRLKTKSRFLRTTKAEENMPNRYSPVVMVKNKGTNCESITMKLVDNCLQFR